MYDNHENTFKCVKILYVGKQNRGERLQSAAGHKCLHFTVSTGTGWDKPGFGRPDIVVLENFPESQTARAAFYHFRQDRTIRFAALNGMPHARAFLHLNGLSFIRMLHLNAPPEIIIQAVTNMTEAENTVYRKSCETSSFLLKRESPGCIGMGSNCDQPCF